MLRPWAKHLVRFCFRCFHPCQQKQFLLLLHSGFPKSLSMCVCSWAVVSVAEGSSKQNSLENQVESIKRWCLEKWLGR